jgi:hypothetical protein
LEPTLDYPDTTMAAPLDAPAPDARNGRSRWMLAVAALLASVAAVLVAGAHGAHVLAAPPPPVAVTVTARPAPSSESDKDRLFLANLHRMAPHLFVGPPSAENDAKAIRVGRNMADRIAGASPEVALDGLIASADHDRAGGQVDGIPSDRDLTVLAYAAMLAYCPQSLPNGGK